MNNPFFKRASWRLAAALPLAALLGTGLAGCSGGDSSNNNGTVVGPNLALIGLSQSGTALAFLNANAANSANSTRSLTGLQNGETIVAIDYRAAPLDGTSFGLYGVTNQNRLVTINTATGAVTAVGGTFDFDDDDLPTLSDPGFDFNPVVDRIRLVQGTFNGRLNQTVAGATSPAVDSDANVGGVQSDGTLAYAAGTAFENQTPNIVAAAYTNNFVGTTSTINYAIDLDRNLLVTQGRPDPDGDGPLGAVSPNTGQLFPVGSGLNIGDLSGSRVSFEISNSDNATGVLLVSDGGRGRLYLINLATGRAQLVNNGNNTAPYLGVTIAPAQ